MKTFKPLAYLLLLIIFLLMPRYMMASSEIECWTVGPWKAQDMSAWGVDMLVVDFGPNGLWMYDGSWTKLSSLDPEGIIALSDSKLVVNFGSRGLWQYDRRSWERIALGPAETDKVN